MEDMFPIAEMFPRLSCTRCGHAYHTLSKATSVTFWLVLKWMISKIEEWGTDMTWHSQYTATALHLDSKISKLRHLH